MMQYTNFGRCSRLLMLMVSLLLGACSTAPLKVGDPVDVPVFPADRVLDPDAEVEAAQIWDPLEGVNRTMYRFNYHFDRYVFLPGVAAYQYVTPDPVEKGLHNFFQ